MSVESYQSNSNKYDYEGSAEARDNPLVKQRKLKMDDEWKELINHQAIVVNEILKKEKEQKQLKMREFNETLNHLIQEKELQKQRECYNKQKEAESVQIQKQEYDHYLKKSHDDKLRLKRELAEDNKRFLDMHNREKEKNHEDQRKIEAIIVKEAYDKEQEYRRNQKLKQEENKKIIMEMMQQKELLKKEEFEKKQKEKEEVMKMIEKNTQMQDLREKNYKLYYQQLTEKQKVLQKFHEDHVISTNLNREKAKEELISKHMDEYMKRIGDEELKRMLKKQEDKKALNYALLSQLEEKKSHNYGQNMDNARLYDMQNQNSLSYQEYIKSQQLEKKEKQQLYRSILEVQAKEREENIKNMYKMSDIEKKINQNDPTNPQMNYMIPGIANSKFSNSIGSSPILYKHSKESSNLDLIKKSPYTNPDKFDENSYRSNNNNNNMDIFSPHKELNGAISQPNLGKHHPINNPIPNNVQNPFIIQNMQNQKPNFFASMANNNLIGPK